MHPREGDSMNDKLVERIRRCLALAESAGNDPEGILARARAESMAAKAGIDLGSIQIAPKDATAERWFYEPSSNALWRALLAMYVCQYVGMDVIRSKDKLHLLGRKTAFDAFMALYVRAEAEIDAEARRYIARFGGGRSDADTFRKSAASGFGERLARHKSEAESSENGRVTASVATADASAFPLVMASRAMEVQSLKSRLYGELKTKTVASRGSSHARGAGYAFGSRMGVHKAHIG
jgi:hypothetical protein